MLLPCPRPAVDGGTQQGGLWQGHCQAALRLDDGSEDGAVSASGQVWGTSLHGIFDLPGLQGLVKYTRGAPRLAAAGRKGC